MEFDTGSTPDIAPIYGNSLAISLTEMEYSEPWETRSLNFSTPNEYSLIGKVLPAEDQYERGTCATFAVLAAAQAIHDRNLSEQHAYNLAWNRYYSGHSIKNQGTSIEAVLESIKLGICDLSVWPYNPYLVAGNFPQNPEPDEVKNSTKYKVSKLGKLRLQYGNKCNVLIRALYETGIPVVITVPAFLEESGDWNDGFLIETPEGTPSMKSNHAVVIVGYNISSRFILIQNSWGYDWGIGGVAMMTFDYIERYVDSAFWLQS